MTLASTLMLLATPIIVSQFAAYYRQIDYVKTLKEREKTYGLPVEEFFDFIIVGGGTAGCVLARRLSDANHTVLLLEAGGNPPPIQQVPMLSVYTKFHPDINFNYQSTKQKNAALANGGILKTSAGKMLGGSSSHNDMMYERGHPLGYDEWAKWTDDDSWKYENLLPFFKKAENYMGNFTETIDQHGVGGPMTVSQPEYAPGKEVWLAAGKQQKFKEGDANGPQKIGFSPNEFTKKKGRRVSTYSGYIEPIENTSTTLTVRRYSVVQEILFDKPRGKPPQATGVRYTRHGLELIATAKKEVILSAGSYISPILLIKSGIGPFVELIKAGKLTSVVKHNENVGKNLMDHPFLEVGPIFVKDKSKAWQMEQNLTFEDMRTFLDKGDGPLTSSYTVGIAEAFIASNRSQENKMEGASWPDLQVYYEYLGTEKDSVVCYVGFNRPYSRGQITLNTSATGMEDDFLPIVEYNSYQEESDFDATIYGIKFCLNTIEKTKAFQAIGAEFSKKPIKGCTKEIYRSDEYWKCYIKQLVDSTYHASGTCKMGKSNDTTAVVDPQLKVIGVKGLRVVDASIMPRITNANTAAPTVMIGEKGAQMIIDEYKKKK